MTAITVELKQSFQVEARAAGIAARMDESVENGGDGAGLTPSETLLAALSGCAAITLRMYAQKKQWPLTGLTIKTTLERPAPSAPDSTQRIVQSITLEGPLDAEQKQRLLQIAGKCPVHKTLQGPLVMEERLA